MAILGDLLVQGRSRFLQKIYAASLDIGEDTTIAGTLTLSKTNDAAGTSDNSPALVVGGTATTAHLELDSNEIMAKTNATTVADIYINANGGVVYLSKSDIETQVRGNLRVQGTSTFTGASTHSGNLTVSGTTSLAGTSVSSDLNVANNAKVNGVLTVEEEIRSPKWIIDNIANLGGEFIIAPTIVCENNTSVNISGPSNNLYTITVTDGSITSNTFGGIAWSTGSVVKVSGTINDTVLVSINGTMTRALNQTTGTIQFTVNSNNITLTAGTYTGTKVKNLHIMMYKVGNVAPVGIFMTSYGQSHYPYIDIYSGTTSGSFYSPTTRLGYLNGLTDENGNALKINNISPTGWGLYTSNGYFSGTIVSTSGKIGGFNLDTTKIYSGTNSISSTTVGVYLGTDGIRNYNSASQSVTIKNGIITAIGADVSGKITATSGEIGGFAIDSSSIHTKNVAVTSNADNSISLSSTDFTRTINDTSRAGLRFAIGDKFGITGDGILYTNGANITNINANNISTGTVSVGVLPESVKNENIEIGGRNLLYDTSDWSKWPKTSKATADGDVLTCTNTDTSAFQRANGWFVFNKADMIDREIVVSFDAKKTDSTELSTLVFQLFTTSAAPKSVVSGNIPEGTRFFTALSSTPAKATIENARSINASTWTRVCVKFVPSEVLDTSYTDMAYLAVYIGIKNVVGSAQFRHIKAEFGNCATDWTPAPEDVVASIDANSTGLGIKWNYSAFSDSNRGEAYLCARDMSTGTFTDAAGWVWFNGAKRTVPKGMVNPNSIALNKTIYVVCRLSSASATTGTNYIVWYDSGWKYLTTGINQAASGASTETWTWAVATDMVLASFVMLDADSSAIVNCQQFTPPLTSQQVTSGDTSYAKAAAAQSIANAAAPKSSAISRTQRIYWRATSNTKPSANTTWLSTSGDGYGNWSLNVPQLTKGTTKYPFLYTAVQSQTVAQQAAGTTCTCSAVMIDDSTTIIDGGNIITGSIVANKIQAGTITADKLDTTSINSSGILTLNAFASTTQSDILNSNVEIGGRNLIYHSNQFRAGGVGNTNTMTQTVDENGYYKIVFHSPGGSWNSSWWALQNVAFGPTHQAEIALNEGDSFTVSFIIRAEGCTRKPQVYLKSGMGYYSMSGSVSEDWSTIWYTGTWKDDNNIAPHLSWVDINADSTYWIKAWKLEKGNKPTDWTPAPEDVSASLSLKANKDTLTTEINASADTVKINADRVNIEGAAIFSSGRLSQTSLDNAYDANGAAADVQANLDAATAPFYYGRANSTGYIHLGYVPYTVGSASNYSHLHLTGRIGGWLSTTSGSIDITFKSRDNNASYNTVDRKDSAIDTSFVDILVYTGTDNYTHYWLKVNSYWYAQLYAEYEQFTQGEKIRVTDAPTGTCVWKLSEQNSVLNNTANAREQTIYHSAGVNTTSMAATQVWVTDPASGGGEQNVWTTIRPEYDSQYPVLFVAMQRQTIAQMGGTTCTCTTPTIDKTTTVIDGGRIITGSITADAINANAITANLMKANVISAVNNGTGTINADKINASNLTIGYSQLTNPPTIPSKVSDLTNDSGFQTASQVTEAIDNLEIGGRNLLFLTKDFATKSGQTNGGYLSGASMDTREPIVSETYKGLAVRHFMTLSINTATYYDLAYTNLLIPVSGKSYVFSFYAKGTGKIRTHFYPNNSGGTYKNTGSQGQKNTVTDGATDFAVTSDWQRFWVRFEIGGTQGTNTRHALLRVYGGNDIYVCGLKFEEGTKATDWTPAPEDVDASIPTKVSDLTNDSGFQTSSQVDTAITSKGYQTSSQVETAITSKGYATTSQAQGYATTAESNAKNFATDAVNNLEIGGRNLVRGTSGDWSEWYTPTPNGANQSSAPNHIAYFPLDSKEGDFFTASLEVEFSGVTAGSRTFAWRIQGPTDNVWTNKWNPWRNIMVLSPPSDGVYRFSVTNEATSAIEDEVSFKCGARADYWGSGKWRWRKVKVERGTKATDWTPAPEDVDASIASVATTANNAAPKTSAVAEEQYIYRSATSGTTSMAGTTTWVTAPTSVTASTQNAWTTKRPEYSSSYPVLFIAKQRKTVDGTVVCTTPVKDDTTTVIDGGHITTGTIDADRISTTVVNAINANVSDTINADKINVSAISIGSLNGASDYATKSDAQGYANAKDDAIAAAAKRTDVAVAVTAIDYDLGTATLQATLYIDGTVTTSNVTYKWLKDGSVISGQTARTLSVTAAMGLSHVYSCTVTYS